MVHATSRCTSSDGRCKVLSFVQVIHHVRTRLDKAKLSEHSVSTHHSPYCFLCNVFVRFSDAYSRLFRANTPLAKLKDAAFNGRLFSINTDGANVSLGVTGRSLAWKVIRCCLCPGI